MQALVAWREGLFLTEGTIGVLSMSSLFPTRVGVYVGVGSTGMGASADTIPKEADAAGWVEVQEVARPVGPNLQQHAWPSKTLSPTTNLLRSLQTLKDSL